MLSHDSKHPKSLDPDDRITDQYVSDRQSCVSSVLLSLEPHPRLSRSSLLSPSRSGCTGHPVTGPGPDGHWHLSHGEGSYLRWSSCAPLSSAACSGTPPSTPPPLLFVPLPSPASVSGTDDVRVRLDSKFGTPGATSDIFEPQDTAPLGPL
eukprot:3795921-Rhodomonas_salina.4